MDNLAAPIPSTSPRPAVQPAVFSSPAESPSRRWLLWSAGGLTFLIFGIAIGVFGAKFFSQSPSPSQLALTPSPTLLPIPSPVPDLNREPSGSAATADWKTYVSPNNYSIKYPKNWIIISSNAAEWKQEVGTPKFSVASNEYKITFSFPTGFGPSICIFSDQPDFTKSSPDNPIIEGSKCPGEFVEVEGDMFVFRRLFKPTPPPREGYPQEWSVYTKDENGNFVTVPPINYDVPLNYDPVIIREMDQILSTFKFISPSG